MVNADNLIGKTKGEKREGKKKRVMRVHGAGMKKLAARLGKKAA